MNKKKIGIGVAIAGIATVGALAFNMFGSSDEIKAENLMEGISAEEVQVVDNLESYNEEVSGFAVRLFKESADSDENTLISPVSVMAALSMTANGAKEDTLEQMENVLGMSKQELNLYMYSYLNSLPQGDKYKLKLANSIWFRDEMSVKKEFLQTNANYYGAEIYKADFNNRTCKDINMWVNQNTDGVIPNIVDKISDNAVMYIINTLAFEAEWDSVYKESDIETGVFTKEDGTKQSAEFMYDTLFGFVCDEKAKGFVKKYKDDKYAFVALLPNEGVTVSEYIKELEEDSIYNLLNNIQYDEVITAIPKFETEYDVDMVDCFKKMGMKDAFDDRNANFKDLGTCDGNLNIYISEIKHNTFISVGEMGTKAGAATVVETNNGGNISSPKWKICLDRPFVYMIVDMENNIPLFIGTMMDMEK